MPQAKEWQRQHPSGPPLKVSVNLSARQFRGARLVWDVRQALIESGLRARDLVLEITESVAMDDAPATARMLRELRSLGVLFAIDDFGTGYSSLSYLKHLPVDYLKIDRSFIMDLGKESGNEVLVSTIVALAHSFGLRVIAEGVETDCQLARLRKLGCDMGQGYNFSKPLPNEVAGALLDDAEQAFHFIYD